MLSHLFALAVGTAVREEAMTEVKLLAGVTEAHAKGLELEHSQQAWPLDQSNDDKRKLHEIKAFINDDAPSGDVVWDWQDDDASWTYGLVRLTATGAREAMALHMLHRHGLAPLLASRDGTFSTRFGGGAGERWLEVFVQTEEESDRVQQLFAMLLDVSLSGLRNFHSYDHNGDWFSTYASSDSSRRELKDLGSLQVCHSEPTIQWMTQQGVGSHRAVPRFESPLVEARHNFDQLLATALGGDHVEKVQRFLTTGQGNVTVENHSGMTADASEFGAALLSKSLRAEVVWEEVGTQASQVDIPLTDRQYADLVATGQRAMVWVRGPAAVAASPVSDDGPESTASEQFLQKAYAIMQDFVVTHVTAHRAEMAESRLAVWAGEEAEIYQVALEVQQAMTRSFVEITDSGDGIVRAPLRRSASGGEPEVELAVVRRS